MKIKYVVEDINCKAAEEKDFMWEMMGVVENRKPLP